MVVKRNFWGSFPKEKGWEGLNNAAINTFNSNVISSFVRENIQNSNDARQKDTEGNRKKLLINIEHKTIDSKYFPNHDEFINILESIANDENNAQHKLYFKQALASIKNDKAIEVLIYEDFNTTGLSGNDDDANSSFNACVLSEGQSVKADSDSSGSYGIGKNSIFGLSKIRTILYSSQNEKKEIIIQGISKLASYRKSHKTYESRVYYGLGNNLTSIRNKDLDSLNPSLQELYVRDQPGLSQYAFCPNLTKSWKDDLTMSILKNYWPLLFNNELEVNIKEQGNIIKTISATTLDSLMNSYYSPDNYDPEDIEPKGNPYDYYKCYESCKPKNATVHMLGSIRFYFTELDHKKTNRVLYIRNGMVISADEIWGFGAIGYCGIVECTNMEGNVFLKMMEPPEHNRFDPSRLNEKSEEFKSSDGEKAFKEIKKLVRESLNEILNKYRKKAEDIPWLNNLLQSIKGLDGSGSGNRTDDPSERETLERVSSIPKRTLGFSTATKNSMIDVGEGGNKPVLPPEPPPPPPPGPPPPPPGPPPPPPGPQPSSRLGGKSVRFRIFRKGNSSSGLAFYKIIIATDEAIINKNFTLRQVGDSGNVASFEMIEVNDSNGEKVGFNEIRNKENELIGYQINSVNIPNQLEIKIKEPYKSTFTIQST